MRRCQTCGRLHDDKTEACPRDGAKLQDFKPTFEPGQKVAGGYSIVAALGVGQSGEVYEGREEAQGARVIVRLLAEDVAKDRRLSDVVRRHLLKQQDFSHKYVVRTRAVDQHENRILFVREWVEGTRLEDLLASEGALKVQRALGLGIRICTALAEAHKVGLLHLQLRASNVFVVPGEDGDSESVRLVDFGVGPRRKIGPRPYYGAPSTLSPEQVEGKIVSFKSDMFAAGLLLYRMLAGTPAFGGSDEEVVKQICEAPVPPIKYRTGDPIPMELWTFVRQALEKKPIHRPIGMAQMAERLKELAGDAAAGRLSLEPPSPAETGTPAKAGAAEKVQILTPPLERTAIGRIELRKRSGGAEQATPDAGAAGAIDVEVGEEEPQEQAPTVAAQAEASPHATPHVEPPTDTKAAEADVASAKEGVAGSPPPSKPAAGPETDETEARSASPTHKPTAAKGGAKPPPKSPPKPPKTETPPGPGKADAGEAIEPSSATQPMEADILEEVAIPPPMRGPQVPPRRGTGSPEAVLAATFRRGLLYGFGAGLAVAVILFLLGRFACRSEHAAPPTPPSGPGAGTTATDAGSPDPRLTAEGPMLVSVVPDAGTTPSPAGDTGNAAADVSPAPEEETTAVEASAISPPVDIGRPAVDAAPAPTDFGRPSPDRAAAVEAGTAQVAEAGRPADARTDAGRAETGGSGSGGVSAEDLARANELVSQGDTALGARNFGGARSAYEEALRLHPQNNRAKIGLGRTAFQQGNFEDAVRYLEPIYRNQGNMDLGMAYVRVGRLGDAKRQFEKLLERNPNNTDAQRALEAVQRQLGE